MVPLSAMLYGMDCWPSEHVQKMNVVMQILRWTGAKTVKNRLRNEMIHRSLEFAWIEDKLRENCQRCFRHIQNRSTDAPARSDFLVPEVETRKTVGRN